MSPSLSHCGPLAVVIVGDAGPDVLVGKPSRQRRDLRRGRRRHAPRPRGDDILHGGDGTTTPCTAGEGDDCLDGDEGDDRLDGGDGNDRLRGGEGDDVLHGGPGFDVCIGGPGNDVADATCEVFIQ